MLRFLLAMLCLLAPGLAVAAAGTDEIDGRAILARATEAAGGDGWANARTLTLSGHAVYWGPNGSAPKSTADDYRMWRVYDPGREAAHAAEGKVRIVSSNGGKVQWTVGFDGTTTWNERGIVPADQAAVFWASNFGFGIIRHAGQTGFKAERVADGSIDGHPLYKVRLTDPSGGVTLFGIDRASFSIRTMGFTTPKGWHERTYDDFVTLSHPRWLQARKVTLYYNGVKSNEVYWTKTVVNGPVDDALFAPPRGATK